MRKTKIVCTLGPASETEEVIRGLCLAGMNVARMNFSHNTHADHQRRIDLVKKVREELELPIAIMLDTKGPEYRIKTFENGSVTLHDGDLFTFTTEDVIGDESMVSVSYAKLPQELEVGDTILLNNGLLSFLVERIEAPHIECRVICGGMLSDRKSMSFPGKVMKQPYLSEQDKCDIRFGVENGVDYIACSFVSTRQDLLDVHEYLRELGADDIELIAKIENQSGVDHIEEICQCCDGIMVARGDMGVEIPFEQLPSIQKKLITKCRLLGKRVITATEMLESMITNPRPTRAEISDVANAVFDGTSAIMLSGETAAGKYPVLTVETMSRIAEQAEKSIDYTERFHNTHFRIQNAMDAISHTVCGMSMDLEARAIVVASVSGKTVRMVSRFRSPVDIVGLSVDEKTFHQLSLSWGVIPVMCELYPSQEVLFYSATKIAKQVLKLQSGDKVIITGGSQMNAPGSTNTIRFETV
jgi:pyruvate kinase